MTTRPTELPRPRCECSHLERFHHEGDGACLITLPPFLEEELPEWRCPCRRFVASSGPWRWHPPTQSWTLRPPAAAAS